MQEVVDIFLNSEGSISISKNSEEEHHFFELLKIGSSTVYDLPQAFIAFNEDTEEIRSGQFYAPDGFEQWVLNFGINKDSKINSSTARARMAFYNMAKESEIEISQSRLLEKEGLVYFMTKRFDRSGKLNKSHTQSLSSLRHFDFKNRFSYEQVFETMRLLRLPYQQAEQMFRRVVFNIIHNNYYESLKSISFIMNEQGEWKLATFNPMNTRSGNRSENRHMLSINGKFNSITKNDLLELARSISIKKATHIIDEIEEVSLNWSYYAENQEVPNDVIERVKEGILKV